MEVHVFNGNGIQKSEKSNNGKNVLTSTQRKSIILLRYLFVLFVGIFLESCASINKANNVEHSKITISEITTYQTSLSKSDVAKYFCNNMTEYFNTFKYYKISTEVYKEKEKQSNISTTRVTKQGGIYELEYIGAAGSYVISFSNKEFPEAEEIFTFARLTVLGNAIRGKVYDTFSAWIKRQEIALKANYNSDMYWTEVDAAVEVENWYNSLSVSED
jgi:hypothetical protein